MDVAEGENNQLAAPGGLGSRGDRRIGDDDQRQLALLVAGPELAQAHERGRLGQPLAEVDNLGVM